jgi:Flp pilus assembly pilin Flp
VLDDTAMRELLKRLLADDSGAEALEFCLIVGLVLIAALAVTGTVATKALAR